LGRVSTYQYDEVDNQTLKLDARGTLCTLTYDPDNRLITEDFSNPSVDVDNYTNTYTYDAANNQTELSAPTGTVTRHFSGRNNRLWEANADDRRVTYTYDCAENRDTMMDADNGLFTYTHDAKNRLTSVINPKNEVTTIAYDRADRETRRDLADTTFTTRDYDNAGRIDVLSNERFAGSVISRFTYTYDCADNRTDVTELDGTRVTWTYDRKYELLSEYRDDTSPASSYRNTYT
jgi:YD repeat-containing protein